MVEHLTPLLLTTTGDMSGGTMTEGSETLLQVPAKWKKVIVRNTWAAVLQQDYKLANEGEWYNGKKAKGNSKSQSTSI